jgi:antitoxin MazE
MRAVVKMWGTGASVRFPAGIMQAVHLNLDAPVDVREEGGRLVIEPIRDREFAIEKLLEGITPENLHTEIDIGAPKGKELL